MGAGQNCLHIIICGLGSNNNETTILQVLPTSCNYPSSKLMAIFGSSPYPKPLYLVQHLFYSVYSTALSRFLSTFCRRKTPIYWLSFLSAYMYTFNTTAITNSSYVSFSCCNYICRITNLMSLSRPLTL